MLMRQCTWHGLINLDTSMVGHDLNSRSTTIAASACKHNATPHGISVSTFFAMECVPKLFACLQQAKLIHTKHEVGYRLTIVVHTYFHPLSGAVVSDTLLTGTKHLPLRSTSSGSNVLTARTSHLHLWPTIVMVHSKPVR